MPQYKALITVHAPAKRGEPSFEALPSRAQGPIEAKDEQAARIEFHILTDLEQRARRAKTGLAVTCRFDLLEQAEPEKK